MKKFIILIYITLFYTITPSYGISHNSPTPCPKLFIQTKEKPPSKESYNEMIQALMDYSGEPREAPWIQRTIEIMNEKNLNYPDSTEMQAILKFLEEKIGNKSQFLKALKASLRSLSYLRENSLDTHLKPLFETLEDIFGEEIVLNQLKQSIKIIKLKSDRVKEIVDLFRGHTPILIFEGQEFFDIQLDFTAEEIKNLFTRYSDLYTVSPKNFIGLKTGEYQRGIIQILWPFIKSFIKENLKPEEKTSLNLESEINRKTIETIKNLLLITPQILRIKSGNLTEFFNLLMGKEKFSINFNNESIQLHLEFKAHEIGQLILEYRNGFLKNTKEKLKSNLEILWPFILAFVKKNLESQKDEVLTQEVITDATKVIKNLLTQTPHGFVTDPISLDNFIKTLKGEKEISFTSSSGETITLKLNIEDPKIVHLFSKNSYGFFLQSKGKLKSSIQILWPFIEAYVKKNLIPQEKSQEIINNKTVQAIEKAIIQSIKGFALNIESLENLIKLLTGKIEISFTYNNKTIKVRFNLKKSKIGQSFLNDPQGFPQLSQKRLESTIKTLWPFIEAYVKENLNPQEKSQEIIESKTIQVIERAIFQSPQGFSSNIESLENLIKVLTGEKEISFTYNNKTITLKFNFEKSKIGQSFLKDPHGFSKLSQKKLESTIKILWPFIEAYVKENLNPQEKNQEIIENKTIQVIERAIFKSPQGFSANIEALENLIKILTGEEPISFQFYGQIIKLRLNLTKDEIGELFLSNPYIFINKSSKKVEKVFQNLWPSLKEDLEPQKGTVITLENPKHIIKKALVTPNQN